MRREEEGTGRRHRREVRGGFICEDENERVVSINNNTADTQVIIFIHFIRVTLTNQPIPSKQVSFDMVI